MINKVFFLLFATFLFVAPFFVLRAQVIPFGGKILYTDFCTCSENVLIVYLPVRSFMPKVLSCRDVASTVYSYALSCHTLRVGQQILGTTISPDVCLTGSHCHPHPVQAAMGLPWLIKLMGTSR
jgi:hypothetical protein